MRNMATVLLLLAGVAFPLVDAYHIDPVDARQSGWALGDENHGVSEILTCCWDQLDSASGGYVELFAGDYGQGGAYNLSILEYPGGTPVAYQDGGTYVRPQHWVRFDRIRMEPGQAFTKGKQLEFHFTRGGSDSLQYYWADGDPYKYGFLATNQPHAGQDLAMRCLGRLNAVDSVDFGACEPDWWSSKQGYYVDPDTWTARVQSAKVRDVRLDIDWHCVQFSDSNAWDFTLLDASLGAVKNCPGCRALGLLTQVPAWASTRVVLRPETDSLWPQYPLDTCIRCAPRGLQYPNSSDSNLLARFLRRTVAHCDSGRFEIHDWEVLNEVNSEDTTNTVASWWEHPNRYYTDTPYCVAPTLHDMCSLYVRMAWVTAQAVRSDSEHHGFDRIAVNSLCQVNNSRGPTYAGKDWLEMFYDIVERNNIPHFWNAISVHPYHEDDGSSMFLPFKPGAFEASAETLRKVMHEHGDYGELWNTEFDRPGKAWWDSFQVVSTEQQDADYCSEMFVTAEGMRGLPGGGFDRNYWWLLRQPPVWGGGCWALVDSMEAMNPYASFYAFKQTAERLTGMRFNGRVMTGDASTDSAVRMCEFEDTSGRRTWVCWRNWGSYDYGQPPPVSTVPLPVRNDTLQLDSLEYTGNEQPTQVTAVASGWLGLRMGTRPVIVTETKAARRPELVADSVRFAPVLPQIGMAETVRVWVRNRDTSVATPETCTTGVRFTWNGDSFGSADTAGAIGPGATVRLSYVFSVPVWMNGLGLLAADANPGMRYVEREGTDDNTGYERVVILHAPTGTLDAVMPPNHMTNEPLLLCRMSSISLEKDSTGNTPADSVRLVQRRYSKADTLLDSATTGWFGFRPDTAWRFLLGQGRYRVTVRYKDGMDNLSPAYPDSADTVVVFDTIPAVGSVSIDSGARFARAGLCTLQIAVTDSGAGLRAMRLGTRLPNFVRNSGCIATDGVWALSGCTYDSPLSMVRFNVGTSGTSSLYQTVPSESIWPHMPDSFHLTSDVLVSLPGADSLVVGSLKFGYRFTHDQPARESLTVIASIPFTGGIACHAGINNLDTCFVIGMPAPDTFWQFQGGYVQAVVSGSGTSGGQVYLDNIKLQVSGRYPGASWWRPCSTAAAWDLMGDCGWTKLYVAFLDSAGVENSVPLYDSIILDNQSPVVHIGCPTLGAYVNGTVSLTGVAFDQPIPNLDTFFEWRRLQYRHADSTNWLPCDPDSVSYTPAWMDTGFPGDVYLGSWNTTNLAAGTYWLKLSALDSAQNLSDHQIWVVVKNDTSGDSTHAGPGGGGSGMGNGSVFIGSTTGKVLHLDDNLDSLSCIQVSDSGSPAYVTAILELSDDSILVLDARNKRIHKMHKSGQNRRRLVSNLSLPVALVQDSHSNFWLADKGVSRIGKFRRDGTLVFTKGGLGADSLHFNSPEAIAVKGALVYVADSKNDRVIVLDTNGVYKASITGDFSTPTAVMVTDSGTIYLTDGSDGKLKGITPLGGSIVAISASGGSKLRGLVPSENGHSVFTLAPQPNVVHKLRIQSDDSLPRGVQSAGNLNLPKLLSLSQPFPNPARTRLTINYALPRQARVTLKLYDIAGKLVTTFANGSQRPGYYHIAWNRQDARGRSVPAGVYFCALTADGKRLTRKVVLTE